MNKEKQKFKITNHLFWLVPIAATIMFLLFRLILDSNDTYAFIEKAMNFNPFIAIPLLAFLYLITWLLGCSYHKKSDNDVYLKQSFSSCVIAGLLLLAVYFLLHFFIQSLDVLAIVFIASISEIGSISYYIYRIVSK